MKLNQQTIQSLKVTLFVVSFLLCGWHLFSFIDLHAPILIYADRWHSMDPIFNGDGLWQGFSHKHGPHRMGLIYLLFKTTAQLSDWNSRWDMFLQGAIYGLSALMAFRLKFLLFKRLDWRDWIIPCIFLTTQASQTITFNPYVHGLIPFFATTISLSYFIRNRIARQITLSLLLAIAVFSGFALVCSLAVILFETFLFFTNRRKVNYMVLLMAVSAIVLMLGTQNKSNPISLGGSLIHYLQYALWLIQDYVFLQYHPKWVWISIVSGIGLFFIIYKAFPTLKNWESPQLATIFILVGSTLIFVALSLSGRADMGLGNALTSRYVPAIMPLMLSIYFVILSIKPQYLKITSSALLAVILLRFQLKTDIPRINNVISLTEEINAFGECLKQEKSLDDCEAQTNFTLVPASKKEGLQKKVDFLKANNLNIFKQEN